MKYYASVSGGKDSTAMLLLILRKKMPLDEVIFCDSCCEFDGVYETIGCLRSICRLYNVKFTTLRCNLVDLIKKYKYWPHYNTRFCTSFIKRDLIKSYLKSKFGKYKIYIGFAFDENERAVKLYDSDPNKYIFPLLEYGITENDCLNFCYKNGIRFGGLYNHFSRLGCSICPFKRTEEIKNIVRYYPKTVKLIKKLEKITKDKYHKYGIEYYIEKYGGYGGNNE